MPYLALDTTCELTTDDRRAATAALTDLYTDELAATASHVAVVIREHPSAAMSLGHGVEGPIGVFDAAVRRGRSHEHRRAFVVGVTDWLDAEWNVPRPNVQVAFTEHDGDQLVSADTVADEQSPDEDAYED